ncbi:MAG: hypothetical protein D6743_00180 [Calditrichaeota bacterium]|nr:MAG: hypothetical protein D6743_00180 [Calditrichota bacterium]
MVYGFDAVEQIANKARRFIGDIYKANLDRKASAVDAINSVQQKLRTLLRNVEAVDGGAVQSIVDELTTARTTSAQKKSEEISVVSDTPAVGDGSSDLPVADNPPSQDARQLKLPGEDDEEILQLIKEIRREKNVAVADEPYACEGSVCVPQVETVSVVSSVTDGVGSQGAHDGVPAFMEKAELYFAVLDDALKTLEGDPENRTALEDIELASNSLYNLAMQLGLDEVGKLPALVLDVTKQVLETDYLMSAGDHQLLVEAIQRFRRVRQSEDVTTEEFKEVLQMLEDLRTNVKMWQAPELNSLTLGESDGVRPRPLDLR